MIFLLLSCNNGPSNQQVLEVVCESDIVTYQSVAEPFMQNYCTSCHSSHLEGAKRYGAPDTVDLDTYSSAKQWSERSFFRVNLQNDMPPGGGVSQAEKDRFMQWALCGTEGSEQERYLSSHLPTNESHAIGLMIENSEFGNDVLMLRRHIEAGGTNTDRFGSYIDELYQINTNGAGFLGYTLYADEVTLVQEVFYDPPIPVLQLIDMESEMETLATIWEAGEERQEWQEWSGEQTYLELADIDPHERDENPLESVWTSSTGEERGWHFSRKVLLSAEWWTRADGYFYETQQFTGFDIPEEREYFEILPQEGWFELMIEEGNP